MSENDGNTPAYPTEIGPKCYSGMTLRQWYAGQAMVVAMYCVPLDGGDENVTGKLAKIAFEIADAMIEEGAK